MNSIIETKDLKLWYGDHQVLKGITMDIPEHQITDILWLHHQNNQIS